MRTGNKWWDESWSPVTGCDKISPGCANCYAEKMARRLQAMGQPKYANGFKVTTHVAELTRPLYWKKPKVVFVCSMADPFHKDVPFPFLHAMLSTMIATPWHTYMLLTKRPDRMFEFFHERANMSPGLMQTDMVKHIWLGVSVESPKYLPRVDILRRIPTTGKKYISYEPALEYVNWDFSLAAIDLLIAGGESGPKHRPDDPGWYRDTAMQCSEAEVSFFMKQMAGRKPIPKDLMIREWPE